MLWHSSPQQTLSRHLGRFAGHRLAGLYPGDEETMDSGIDMAFNSEAEHEFGTG